MEIREIQVFDAGDIPYPDGFVGSRSRIEYGTNLHRDGVVQLGCDRISINTDIKPNHPSIPSKDGIQTIKNDTGE